MLSDVNWVVIDGRSWCRRLYMVLLDVAYYHLSWLVSIWLCLNLPDVVSRMMLDIWWWLGVFDCQVCCCCCCCCCRCCCCCCCCCSTSFDFGRRCSWFIWMLLDCMWCPFIVLHVSVVCVCVCVNYACDVNTYSWLLLVCVYFVALSNCV